MNFPFSEELVFERAESKKSVILTICGESGQSSLAEKGKPHLNLPASNVFVEKSF